MLIPAKVKYRKCHRQRRVLGPATKNFSLDFGEIGLKCMEFGEISSRQIESARKAMSHYTKRGGKIWIKIFPQKSITKKAAEVPMGSGKGSLDHYVAEVRPGTVLFEMGGLPIKESRRALMMAGHKLPVTSKIITKEI